MTQETLLIVGAGGHGRSVAEALELLGQRRIVGFVDDAWPVLREVWDYPVLGSTDELESLRSVTDGAVVAIGNNVLRQSLSQRLRAAGFCLHTVVHPAASVSRRARIGHGCTIMAGAIVGTEAVLGDGVIVNSGAVVDHHCQVAAYGHLGVGSCMAGGAHLGERAWLHAGAAAGYGARIDPDIVVPCGAGGAG